MSLFVICLAFENRKPRAQGGNALSETLLIITCLMHTSRKHEDTLTYDTKRLPLHMPGHANLEQAHGFEHPNEVRRTGLQPIHGSVRTNSNTFQNTFTYCAFEAMA